MRSRTVSSRVPMIPAPRTCRLIAAAVALPLLAATALARPFEPTAPAPPSVPMLNQAPAPGDQPDAVKKVAPKPAQKKKRANRAKGDPSQQVLALNPEKADALFALLAPDRVKVIVFRTPNGVRIRGNAREGRVLAALAKILTREEAAHRDDPGAFLDRTRATADTVDVIKVPNQETFFRVLAFDDVPVIVRQVADGIEVRGRKQDVQVLRQVASITRGQRLQASDKRARASKKAPRADDESPLRQMLKHQQQEVGEQLDMLREQFAHRGEEFARQAAEFREEMHELRERMEVEAEHLRHELAETREMLRQELESFGVPQEWVDRIPGDDDEVITRDYRLPPQHAENLFRLFAPNDIRDVWVNRTNPETVQIRARARDHRTIEALVDLLARNARADKSARL